MDEARRASMEVKYIDADPVPGVDDVVATIVRTEELEVAAFPSRGTDNYNGYLFDPSRSPTLHAIAAEAHRAFRLDHPDASADGTIVYFVGSGETRVADDWLSYLDCELELRDRDTAQPFSDRARCDISISGDCQRLGGGTMLLPLLYGGVLLVFECCASCHSTARELSTLGHRVGEIAAHERVMASAPVVPASRTRPTRPASASWWARLWRWRRGAV